jgi:hypothetical protein
MCNLAQLTQIKRACQQGNTPGLHDVIYVTFMHEVVSLPDPDSNTTRIGQDIGFRPEIITSAVGVTPIVYKQRAGAFVPIDVRRKGATYKAGHKGDGENDYWEPEWEYMIDRVDEIKSYILAAFKGGARMLVLTPDKNGKLIVCPNCTITYDGNITDSENAYKIKIMGDKMAYEPRFYTGAVPLRNLLPN